MGLEHHHRLRDGDVLHEKVGTVNECGGAVEG